MAQEKKQSCAVTNGPARYSLLAHYYYSHYHVIFFSLYGYLVQHHVKKETVSTKKQRHLSCDLHLLKIRSTWCYV